MECESRLMSLLEQDKIDLIKILIRNRFKIYYAVKYAQSLTDKDRDNLAEEMRRLPDG